MGSIKINHRELNRAIDGRFRKMDAATTALARERAEIEFRRLQEKVLSEFSSHPVTQEINAGPSASSSFLSKGNLFSFLGFGAGATPAQTLKSILKESLYMEHIPTYNANLKRFYFKMHYPDQEMIYELTKGELEWDEDTSWVEYIEEGLENLNHYLYNSSKAFAGSRSGPAIQVKSEIGGGSFTGTPYITDIINNLQDRFES